MGVKYGPSIFDPQLMSCRRCARFVPDGYFCLDVSQDGRDERKTLKTRRSITDPPYTDDFGSLHGMRQRESGMWHSTMSDYRLLHFVWDKALKYNLRKRRLFLLRAGRGVPTCEEKATLLAELLGGFLV